MASRYRKSLDFGFVFLIAAILILIFALDVVWWQAILVALLASMEFKVEWS